MSTPPALDYAAVVNGLTLPWSTGPVEGTVTKAKLLNRSGYGRASTRLLRRRLYAALLGARVESGLTAAKVGLAGETRDPVCGMRVDPDKAPRVEYRGQRYAFCAAACRQQFVEAPTRFLRSAAILV